MICAAALVLLLDASSSIVPREWREQIEATAAALESREVEDAIRRGGPMAVAAVAFADIPGRMLGWHVLASGADAAAFAATLRDAPRGLSGGTGLGAAIGYAHRMMGEAPCEADRYVVDLSTNGEAPEGDTAAARDAAQADGVTINVISVGRMAQPESLREHAVTGDGFLIHAADWSRYAALVRRKVILETAAR